MRTQIVSTKPRTAFAPARACIQAVSIAFTLAVEASAGTFHPLGPGVQPQTEALATVSTLSAPSSVWFGLLHAYAPADICAAYGVDALHNEGWTGKGQTIVIVDPYGSPTALSDLQTFSATFDLPEPDLTIIYPDGAPTYSPAMQGIELDCASETSLDLQWAHAIAPDSKLVLIATAPYEATGVQGFPSIFRGIQYAIQNYSGSPISQSFGPAEQTFDSAAAVLLTQYEAIYQLAIAAGCTPLAANSDIGTANPIKQDKLASGAQAAVVYPYPTVCYPASSPSVTSVGGTWLQYHWRWNPQTNFATFAAISGDPRPIADQNPVALAFMNWDTTDERVEAVWREDWAVFQNGGGGQAGGGGLSAIFATPPWQAGLPSDLTQGARALPDLSWNAAEDGGVLSFCTPQGGWGLANGTSCGAPQIAGVVALVNQIRASLGKGPIGHLAPKLYQLPASDFNDIVPQTFGLGPNAVTLQDNSCYGYNVPGFPTTAGFDLTTGMGSPKCYSFVYDLATMFP
jgi:subtilase family serine protease